MQNLVREQPEYAEALCVLGMTDAALGHKEEALREGRHAVELLPITKDAMAGAELLRNLAITYAWTGEKDLAIKQLEELLPLYGPISFGQLRFPSPQSASATKIVFRLESNADTQPQLQPALLR